MKFRKAAVVGAAAYVAFGVISILAQGRRADPAAQAVHDALTGPTVFNDEWVHGVVNAPRSGPPDTPHPEDDAWDENQRRRFGAQGVKPKRTG